MASSGKTRGTLIVLCGPAGVGKSTISLKLSQKHQLNYIVSATTRSELRGDEKGKKYEYISVDQFTERLNRDEFLEYARVYDEYYGTPTEPALSLLADGKDVLLEIDVQGALQIRFQYPDALMIFVMPPDEQTLKQRLVDRARDSSKEIDKRFRLAKREIHMAKGSRAFDHYVINDDIERAVNEVARVVRHKKSGGI